MRNMCFTEDLCHSLCQEANCSAQTLKLIYLFFCFDQRNYRIEVLTHVICLHHIFLCIFSCTAAM